mgnify:CR=1 FL=1
MTSVVDRLYVTQLIEAVAEVANQPNISITSDERNGIVNAIIDQCAQSEITELMFAALPQLQTTIKMFATRTLQFSRDSAASTSHCDTPAASTALPIAPIPEGNTVSKMYVNGTLRSWIHYIELRGANGTQKEHIELSLIHI